MKGRRTWWTGLAAAALSATSGCEIPDPLDEARWSVSAPLSDQHIAVGDTATLHASAHYCDFVTCPSIRSDSAPERFLWESFHPATAEISERGLLRARAIGTAGLKVTFLARNGRVPVPFTVIVVPHIAGITIRADRDTARVGDTVAVTVRAVDESGATVFGAPVWYSHYSQTPGVVELVSESRVGHLGDHVIRYRTRQPGTVELSAARSYIRHTQSLRVVDTLIVIP